jgi:hypothetical protein
VERRFAFFAGAGIILIFAVALTWGIRSGRSSNWTDNLTELTDSAALQRAVQLSNLSIATSDTLRGPFESEILRGC